MGVIQRTVRWAAKELNMQQLEYLFGTEREVRR